MQELEKILEEMKISATYAETTDGYGAICVPIGTIERIIRKHMNDGWIPVEERLPEDRSDSDYYESVIVTLLGGRCASGVYRNGDKEWWVEAENGEKKYTFESDVIAWRPLPESYRPENDS